MSFKLCVKGPQSQQDVLETILHVDHNAMIPGKNYQESLTLAGKLSSPFHFLISFLLP